MGKINLRGKSSDKEFMKNVGSVLDLVLPIEPNVFLSNNNINIIWLSPNEWLIETPLDETMKYINTFKSTIKSSKNSCYRCLHLIELY